MSIPVGHGIIGLQANTKSHDDHISRLGFIVWGKGGDKRTKDEERNSKAFKDGCKDLPFNVIFWLFSLLPMLIAIYFVLFRLNPIITD